MLIALLGVSACGGPTAGNDDGTVRTACTHFLDDLPSHLADQRRTSIDRGHFTASYGKPAITITCGVGRPDGFEPTSTCTVVRGVGWFVPPDQVGTRPVDVTATTVDRRPRVQVHVPKDYWPSTAALVDLGDDVRSQLTGTDTCS